MSIPAGWYDDGHGATRWWDGAQWTEHVQPPAAAEPTIQPVTSPEPVEPAPATEPAVAVEQAPAEPVAAEPAADESAAAEPAAVPEAPAAPPSPVTDTGYPPVAGYPPAPGSLPAPGENLAGSYQPGAAPPSYPPTGYPPAGYPAAGATAAPAGDAPKKSKLWIWLTIIGVVVVAIIIGAIFLIIALLNLAGGNDFRGETGETADEKAAVEAVKKYDQALDDVDCELYEESTTQAFRDDIDLSDCEDFEQTANYFNLTSSDYVIEVESVTTDGDTISVETVETYTTTVDENGEELDAPSPARDEYTYEVIREGDAWVIDYLL